ncbi:MAG TPA: substrate-binding domain-containing protein [Streptosporangiaceae bacterium]|nr:substrate-binding domain-containing protein [Streptosporangiaceae bacterium]
MNKERLERYSLTGPENQAAVQAGLAGGDWFRSAVPRKQMKELMRRSDYPAIRDTIIWLGLMGLFAGLGIAFWGSWRALPFFAAYGLLYGSTSDSRWHEAGHGTAFRTRWLDQGLYQLASFMIMRDPVTWRWSHTRHHTDTLIVGRDPEIAVMRPARLVRLLVNVVGLVDVPLAFGLMFRHAAGRLTAGEADFVPASERPKVYRTARIDLAIYAMTIGLAIGFRSWLPVLLIGGPRLYGALLLYFYSFTQHAGMGENVLDYRLNTRTVTMCRLNRFLYWNMNYHVEHHMFPMVPYHRLPELHEEVKGDLAPAYPSIWAAYKEIIPAVLRQLRDQEYYVRRELPPGAAPYHQPGPANDGRALPLAVVSAALCGSRRAAWPTSTRRTSSRSRTTAGTTRSTGRPVTSTTRPTGTARTRRPCCATAWSWGGSSSARNTTGGLTTSAGRRSGRRCWRTSGPTRSRWRTGRSLLRSAEPRPTLETVAARAGVSRSLVSLVLRGSPSVSPGRREAVLRAVAELGYRPNAAARVLAERKSNTVGVLLNDLRQPWFADMLDGLTPALHAGGKAILLGDGRLDRMMDESLTWSFLDLGVDGLVLAGSAPVTATIINVAGKIPTVAVGGMDPDLPHVDVLANDNRLGGTLAVRHLVSLGHRRIAHISGLPSAAGRLRMQAYQDAMRAAGLAGQVRVETGDMTEEGGYRAAMRLLAPTGPERPTAIFAANDLSCVGALSAAAALGVRVPAELSLVGFDNSHLARLHALWLTSVDGAAYTMGQRAARMLLARIAHPDAPREVTLMPPRLEVRGSSGPVPVA